MSAITDKMDELLSELEKEYTKLEATDIIAKLIVVAFLGCINPDTDEQIKKNLIARHDRMQQYAKNKQILMSEINNN